MILIAFDTHPKVECIWLWFRIKGALTNLCSSLWH
jgi:hypothetical protein